MAPVAEEGWTNNDIAKLIVKEYLKLFKNKSIEALILGCTHYPLYEKIIEMELPGVDIINTGKIISNYLPKINNLLNLENDDIKKDEIFLTDTECNFLNVAKNLLGENIEIKSINKI